MMIAWENEPLLSSDDLENLLASAAVSDAKGAKPEDNDWLPTYDLNAAAAQCWLVKAARAASTAETDEASLDVTSKVFANCLAMARSYRRRVAITIKT